MPAATEFKPKSSSLRFGSNPNGNHHRGQTSGARPGGAGGNKQAKYKRFCLHSLNDKSLNSAIEYVSHNSVNRFRTCVVTIISKDSINDSMRDYLVHTVLASGGNQHGKAVKKQFGSNVDERDHPAMCRQQQEDSEDANDYETQVVGHADFDTGLVVLTLDSFMDTIKLLNLSDSMPESCQNKSKESSSKAPVYPLLDAWPKWNQNLIKTLLILFTMSHVIVFYNPEPSIDYNLIQTLKVLEALRMKSMSRICDLFETIASGQIFSQQWIRNCRIACPRALFICDTSYLDLEIDISNKIAQIRDGLEEQIYLLLKKSNLISVASQGNQKSLFCLPDQDDFVFIISQKDLNLLGLSERHQVEPCASATSNNVRSPISDNEKHQALDSNSRYGSQELFDSSLTAQVKAESISECDETIRSDQPSSVNQKYSRLRRFIGKHIFDVRALATQDHDNKQHGATILPRFDDYFNVLLRLKCLLFPLLPRDDLTLMGDQKVDSAPSWPARDERRFVDVYDLLDVDDLFSRRHCYKARLAAFELYARGLQVTPCDAMTHRNSLNTALQYYTNQARGSAYSTNLRFLEDECNRHWLEVGLSSRESNNRNRSLKQVPGKFVAKTISSHSASTRSPSQQNQVGSEREKDSTLCITRKPNGVIVTAGCECGRESSLLIKPNDRKKKLERVDIYRIND